MGLTVRVAGVGCVGVVEFSMRLGKIICIADPEEAAERDRRMIDELQASDGVPTPVNRPSRASSKHPPGLTDSTMSWGGAGSSSAAAYTRGRC